jgi:hypothetical protein
VLLKPGLRGRSGLSCQGVNNLHTFAIENKAQKKKRMFIMKYNI